MHTQLHITSVYFRGDHHHRLPLLNSPTLFSRTNQLHLWMSCLPVTTSASFSPSLPCASQSDLCGSASPSREATTALVVVGRSCLTQSDFYNWLMLLDLSFKWFFHLYVGLLNKYFFPYWFEMRFVGLWCKYCFPGSSEQRSLGKNCVVLHTS